MRTRLSQKNWIDVVCQHYTILIISMHNIYAQLAGTRMHSFLISIHFEKDFEWAFIRYIWIPQERNYEFICWIVTPLPWIPLLFYTPFRYQHKHVHLFLYLNECKQSCRMSFVDQRRISFIHPRSFRPQTTEVTGIYLFFRLSPSCTSNYKSKNTTRGPTILYLSFSFVSSCFQQKEISVRYMLSNCSLYTPGGHKLIL